MNYLSRKYNFHSVVYYTSYFMFGLENLDFTDLEIPVKLFYKRT